MNDYETLRERYKPNRIRVLVIAESPPPAASVGGSRHFYRVDRIRPDDRLFINTIQALYPESAKLSVSEIEESKQDWLERFQADGWYMIEALEKSQQHEVTKRQRQERIRQAVPRLLERVNLLANSSTRIILIKSNVFEVATEPLRQAGYDVLNTKLLDYPGQFNQKDYREKLAAMAAAITR